MDSTTHSFNYVNWTCLDNPKRVPGSSSEQKYGVRLNITGMTYEEILSKIDSLGIVLEYKVDANLRYADVLFLKKEVESNLMYSSNSRVEETAKFLFPAAYSYNVTDYWGSGNCNTYEKLPEETRTLKVVNEFLDPPKKPYTAPASVAKVTETKKDLYTEAYWVYVNSVDSVSATDNLSKMLEYVTMDLEPNHDMSSWVEELVQTKKPEKRKLTTQEVAGYILITASMIALIAYLIWNIHV